MSQMRRTTLSPAPDISRLMMGEGLDRIKFVRTNTEVSPARVIEKRSLNRTQPPPLQLPEENKPSQTITARRKPSKPINTRTGVAKIAVALVRSPFRLLKENYKRERRSQGAGNLYELFLQYKRKRVEGVFDTFFRLMTERRRHLAFSQKIGKILGRCFVQRERGGFMRLLMSNTKGMQKQIAHSRVSRQSMLGNTLKRLYKTRVGQGMASLKSLSELYKSQLKVLRKLGRLLKGVENKHLMSTLCRLIKSSRSSQLLPGRAPKIPKSLKCEAPEGISSVKHRQLDEDLKRAQQELLIREEEIRNIQNNHSHLQRETRQANERTKLFEQTNRDLRLKVQQLEEEQVTLRVSRNSINSKPNNHSGHSGHSGNSGHSRSPLSLEEEDDDNNDNKSVYSSASKKSQLSNFSSRSFVQNASVASFNTMFLLKKLTGKTNVLKECCQFKSKYTSLDKKYNQQKEKLQILQAQHELLLEINKHLQLSIESGLVGYSSSEQVEKTKKENLELKASLESFKGQVKKLREEKERAKKEFKKKLEDMLSKVVKKRAQSVEN